MTASRPIQRNFSAGELSPLLRGREDFKRYQAGVRTMKGFLPLPGGGFTRAPGTIYRGETKGNQTARLVPFEFSDTDALLLEITPGKMRVWSYGDLVYDGGSVFELSVPWSSESQIRKLDFEQTADVVYVASSSDQIRTLRRNALNDWDITIAPFEKGPFLPGNLKRYRKVTCSATTGTIQVTMSHSGMIGSGNAGALLRISVENSENIPVWTPTATVSPGDKMIYNDRIYEVATGTNTGTNPPVHRRGTWLTDKSTGIKWTYLSESFGIVRLISLNSAKTVWTAEVLDRVPEACVGDPTNRWAVGAWSDDRGYPRTLAVYDQRLFAAGTYRDPRTVWFSVIGDFSDFQDGSDPDMGGGYTISGGQNNTLNRIRWLAEGIDGLYIGTIGDVRLAHPSDAAAAIGPTNIRVSMVAAVGTALTRPVVPWTFPLLIDRSRTRLYELQRDGNGLGLPLEVSLPAEHIAARGMDDIAWQSSPTGTVWVARSWNKGLAALVYLPAQEMLGWAQVPIADGGVESLAVTPSRDGVRDVVTMVVRRKINGQTRYFVEELADTQSLLNEEAKPHEAVHLYCSKVVKSDPPTRYYSVPHLAGEEVFAWTDKGAFGPFTVEAGGNVDIGVVVSHAVIGLFDDSHETETLPVGREAPDGSSVGRKHRLHTKTGIMLHRTSDGTVETVSRDFTKPERNGERASLIGPEILGQDPKLYSGVSTMKMVAGHCDEVSLRFRPKGGAPMTVLSVATAIEQTGA